MSEKTALVKKNVQSYSSNEDREKLLEQFRNEPKTNLPQESFLDKASVKFNKQRHLIPKQTRDKNSIFDKMVSTQTFITTILILFLIGLSAVFGLDYYINNRLYFSKNDGVLNYIPKSQKPVSLFLKVDSPEDNLLVYSNTLNITGVTVPNSQVIVSTNDQDFEINANTNGKFSQNITLNLGLNQILISTFDKDLNLKNESRTIFYSEEKI